MRPSDSCENEVFAGSQYTVRAKHQTSTAAQYIRNNYPQKRSLDSPADNFRAAQLVRAALIHAAMHTVMMCPAAASRRTAFGAVVGCSLLALAAAGLDEQGKMPEGVIGLYPSSFDMQVSNVRFCHDLLSSIDPPAAAADTPARTV